MKNTFRNMMTGTLALVALHGAAAMADIGAVEALDGEEFNDTLARVGRVYVAGQPSEAGLDQAKAMGVETVVSLRTPKETEDLDSALDVAGHGMDYVSIPSGGEDHPFSPDEVARFNEVMTRTSGDVLLHCKSGTRATHLYVAWLVDYQGMALEDAIQLGRQIQFGSSPLEGYLGGRLKYQLEDN